MSRGVSCVAQRAAGSSGYWSVCAPCHSHISTDALLQWWSAPARPCDNALATETMLAWAGQMLLMANTEAGLVAAMAVVFRSRSRNTHQRFSSSWGFAACGFTACGRAPQERCLVSRGTAARAGPGKLGIGQEGSADAHAWRLTLPLVSQPHSRLIISTQKGLSSWVDATKCGLIVNATVVPLCPGLQPPWQKNDSGYLAPAPEPSYSQRPDDTAETVASVRGMWRCCLWQ